MTSEATLRAVTPSRVDHGPRDHGARPVLEWIPISQLRLDDSYQRPITAEGQKRIEGIAKSFSWSCFSPCLVAPVDEGLFAIIDGQHRCHSAAMVGVFAVPCQIVDLDQRGQAAAFAAVNGEITSVTQYDILKAALAAGEPWAVSLKEIVENAGARLMTYAVPLNKRNPRDVYAIGLLRRYVESGHGDRVATVLSGLMASDKAGTVFYWSSASMPALLQLVDKFPKTTAAEFGRFLTDEDLSVAYHQGVPGLRNMAHYAKESQARLFLRIASALYNKWRRINVPA